MSERTRLERLLLYKRYIDFLVDKELEKMVECQRARRLASRGGGVRSKRGEESSDGRHEEHDV